MGFAQQLESRQILRLDMSVSPPLILVFAATDPTGGAGLAADVLSIAAQGAHALPVVCAVTVQDTAGVRDLRVMAPEWLTAQARALLEDMPVAAFKLGVLGSLENVAAVAAILADYPDVPVVCDPVLASGRGDALVGAGAVAEDMACAMRALIFPRTTLITPNSVEARRLTQAASEDANLAECARRLIDAGCEYALVTGTHESTDQVMNTLYGASGVLRVDAWERLPGSYHGSGCTLASAIAARLALGQPMTQAVQDAQVYTHKALRSAFRPGRGQFIPQRLDPR
jgi:hydroxymethylpyrimidine/phosphomethylpyrimidine kinase